GWGVLGACSWGAVGGGGGGGPPRRAVGVAVLPLDAPVEVELVVRVKTV
ncbi:RidA family protein, partial [Kitasatospora sp. NPDC054769]